MLLVGGWVVGVAQLVAGVVAIPPVRRRLERRIGIYLSSRTVLGLYLALVVGSFGVATYL